MREIILTQGKRALVDDKYFDELNQYEWRFDLGYRIRTYGVSEYCQVTK